MCNRKLLWAVALAGLLVVAVGLSQAQIIFDPAPPRNRTYSVRVVNETGRAICVKILGYGQNRFFHADLARDQRVDQDFYGGQRAVCVWDDRSGHLLMLGPININRNGTLRIQLPAMAPKAAEGEEAPPQILPKFEIEE